MAAACGQVPSRHQIANSVEGGWTMHKIIGLWSHPRSMSTAMERVMRERGDLWCGHEPFMYDYYVHRKVRAMPHFDKMEDHPVSYADVRDMLLSRAETTQVFFKDMSYYVIPDILGDTAFLDRLTNCFLIRNPLASISSYYKLDPDFTLEEVGIEAQWRHFAGLQDAGRAPIVIEAETIRRNPRKAIGALWRQIGLPYVEKAFGWQDALPADWQQTEGWHAGVTSSNAIRPLTKDEEVEQQATFELLAARAPHLRQYLDHHLHYYDRLRHHALKV
jgi:hypothetical protein